MDRVTYTAFDENQFYQTKRAYNTYSPKDPSKSDIQTVDFASITSGLNKLSNPSFENVTPYDTDDYYGWLQFNKNDFHGTCEFVNDASQGEKAFKISEGTAEGDKDGYFYQRISCSYEGFKYHFDIDAKLTNAEDKAEIIVWQKDLAGVKSVKQTKLALDSTSYKTYSADITMEKGAGNLDIFLHVSKGSATFDNAKLNKVA